METKADATTATSTSAAAAATAPPHARVIAVSTWAGLLGLAGLAFGARVGLMLILAGGRPGWFAPTVVCAGLAGIALTVGAFLAIQGRKLPWLLLSAATASLGVVALLTLVAS